MTGFLKGRRRFVEFFEGEEGVLSMTRLLCFMSFFPASYVVVQAKNADTLGWYLGAFVLSYVGGKTADVLSKPGKPIINAPQAENINLKTEGGDINVQGKSE